MALELFHKVKANTYLKLNSAVVKSTVVPGGVAAVNTSGELVVGGNDEASPVGIFFVQGEVPAYQSTGLLDAQIQGAVGSPGGGKTVSYLAGAGTVLKTDQVASLGSVAIGSELVGAANGQLKAKGMSTAPTVAVLIAKEGTFGVIQMRI